MPQLRCSATLRQTVCYKDMAATLPANLLQEIMFLGYKSVESKNIAIDQLQSANPYE
jgi:hypothetical protein